MKIPLVIIPMLFAGSAFAASDSVTTASKNWQAHCVKCHAQDGSGKTEMGAKLHIIDLTSPAAQGTFTDKEAFLSITKGRTDGHGNQAEVLSDREAQALVTYIRTLQK